MLQAAVGKGVENTGIVALKGIAAVVGFFIENSPALYKLFPVFIFRASSYARKAAVIDG